MLATLTLVNCGVSSHMTGREPYKHHGEQTKDTKIITHVRHAFRTNPMIPEKLVYVAVE